MPGLTPYRQIPYPLIGETISDAAILSMASRMDAVLTTARQNSLFARSRSSLAAAWSAVSVAKGTATYPSISLANGWDTGASGPGATAFWASGNPSRITAPTTGFYLIAGEMSVSFSDAISATPQYVRGLIRKQGTTVVGWDQQRAVGSSYPDIVVKNLVQLNAGQYVEVGVQWSGSEAGPLNTFANVYAALMVVTP